MIDPVPEKVVEDLLAGLKELGDKVQAKEAMRAAGVEFLCDIRCIPGMRYAYRHLRGPDGRVYGIDEQKASSRRCRSHL